MWSAGAPTTTLEASVLPGPQATKPVPSERHCPGGASAASPKFMWASQRSALPNLKPSRVVAADVSRRILDDHAAPGPPTHVGGYRSKPKVIEACA
jgi:hypothetical protein